MFKPVLSAATLVAAALSTFPAVADDTTFDTSEKTGTLSVTIELRGHEDPQPYSLDLDGQPVRNSKGELISASTIDKADYYRRIDLTVPLSGYLNIASGFDEIDSAIGAEAQADAQAATAGIDSNAVPQVDLAVLQQMQEAIEACGDNQVCMADAARNAAAVLQGQNAAVPAMPAVMPEMPNFQRFLALNAVPNLETGYCGTATITVNDHHVGRSMDTGGWISFDYHRQGRQFIPLGDSTPGSRDPAAGYIDTTPEQVTLCGSRVALDFDEDVHHVQLGWISAAVLTVNTQWPELMPEAVPVLEDAESKLVFLHHPGVGNHLSAASFEVKDLYRVTGMQNAQIPIDATISWSITIEGTLPE